jgi:hypothetical protein
MHREALEGPLAAERGQREGYTSGVEGRWVFFLNKLATNGNVEAENDHTCQEGQSLHKYHGREQIGYQLISYHYKLSCLQWRWRR